MAKNIIVYIPDVTSDHVIWLGCNDKGCTTTDLQHGTIAELAKIVEGHKVLVVVPSALVTFAYAKIPGSKSKAEKAIPFALEEILCEDVDTLHFATADKSTEEGYPVAVISKDVMDTLLERFDSTGLRPTEMRPDALALPLISTDKASWTAYSDEEQLMLRTDEYTGYGVDIESALFLLDQSVRQLPEDEEKKLVLFGLSSENRLQLPDAISDQIETRQCKNLLSLFAEGMTSTTGINLLQGNYSYKQQFDRALKPWRPAAVLMILLILVISGAKFVQSQKLNQQIEAQKEQMATILKRTFPSIRRVVRPQKQMQTELKKLGATGVDSGFVSVMDEIRQALEFASNTNLNSISYKTGRMNIDLDTDQLSTLDKFKKKLENEGRFSMKIESANQKDGRIRGRIRVEIRG